MSRRHAAVWLAVAASTVFATLAGPGYASSADVAGRAFVLAPLSGAALGDQATRVAAAGDGTVWTIGAAGSLWRLGAGDLRPVRVFTGHAWSDLAALPDGGLVLASDVDREVFTRTRQGDLSLVAGGPSDDDSGLSKSDGGAATATLICSVDSVTALPDQSVVFADRHRRAVRRVGPDGTISTLYAVTPADQAYGCPGDTAATAEVRDLAGEPGGGLLLLLTVAPASSGEHTSVLRRAAAGTLSEIPGLRAVGSLASAADGSTLLTNDVGAPFPVRRLAPGALRPETILPGTYTSEIRRPGDPFAYDGAPATRFAGAFLSQVVGAPDGGIIATGQDEESRGLIVYVAPAHPTRLAAALEPRSGRATPDGYAVHYRVTRRARVRLAVLNRRGHEVASVGARASPGLNSISLRHRLPFATYTVALTVTSAERIARQAIRVFLGGTLADLGYARRLLVPDEVDVGGGCSNCDPEYERVRFEGCRRIDQRRVDCRYSYPWGERPDERTCTVASAQLHLVGTLFVRRYACPKAPGIPSRPPLGSLRRVLPEQRNPGAPSGSG